MFLFFLSLHFSMACAPRASSEILFPPELDGSWLSGCKKGEGQFSSQDFYRISSNQLVRIKIQYYDFNCRMLSSAVRLNAQLENLQVDQDVRGSIFTTVEDLTMVVANSRMAQNYNRIGYCGYSNWTASNPKSLLGKGCQPIGGPAATDGGATYYFHRVGPRLELGEHPDNMEIFTRVAKKRQHEILQLRGQDGSIK